MLARSRIVLPSLQTHSRGWMPCAPDACETPSITAEWAVVMTRTGQGLSALIVSTLAFAVCFMVWMMFAVVRIPIKKTPSRFASAASRFKSTRQIHEHY